MDAARGIKRFLENDAARGQMVNRHVTPRGHVYKLNFWKNGIFGKLMPPGAKLQ